MTDPMGIACISYGIALEIDNGVLSMMTRLWEASRGMRASFPTRITYL
ncbi:hypothetical protein ACIQAL_05960 [Pseudomonas sp. NPDC088368]|jgi:hypothetical protein